MAAVVCGSCGVTAPEQPLDWSSFTYGRGVTVTCDRCTRQHLRAIEARLDEDDW